MVGTISQSLHKYDIDGWAGFYSEEDLNSILIVLGVILAFSFGTSDFLSKGVASTAGAYKTTLYMLLLSGLPILLPSAFLKSDLSLSASSIALLAAISITTCICFAAVYRAYSTGMLSITSPIVNAFPAFSIIISVAFIGASFSAGSIVALVVVILGIILVSTSFSELRKSLFSKGTRLAPGVKYAFIAAVFLGVSWTLYGYASQNMGYLLPAAAVRLGAAAVGFGMAPLLKREVRPRFGKAWPGLLGMVFLESVGVVIFSLGVLISGSPDGVPILATFSGMSAAVTVSCAIVFLKERLEPNHIVGVAMLIAGIAVLSYLTG